MIRFNLTLCDYLEQYITNKNNDEPYCPICYDTCMQWNRSKDIKHILDCYKEQMVVNVLKLYFDEFQEYPEITESFIDEVWQRVEVEMVNYCSKYQK